MAEPGGTDTTTTDEEKKPAESSSWLDRFENWVAGQYGEPADLAKAFKFPVSQPVLPAAPVGPADRPDAGPAAALPAMTWGSAPPATGDERFPDSPGFPMQFPPSVVKAIRRDLAGKDFSGTAGPTPPDATPVPNLPEPTTTPDLPGPTPMTGPPPMRDAWARDPQFPLTMPSTAGPLPPGVPASGLGAGAVAALYGQKLGVLQAAEQARQAAEDAKQAALGPGLKARIETEQATKKAMDEYREGLKAAQPKAPEFQKMPKVPDVRIRPWLDPEGKDALSVIVQTLGMMAVGASGLALNTPQTAMKYFREAAENWRRDEVDAANSKLKQFEATVQQIKGDNETALKEYEIADKQYGHNLDAKKAMVASRLDELKLGDEALQAAVLPYDEAMKSAQATITNTSTILTHLEKYQHVVTEAQKAALNLPTSLLKLAGEREGLKQALTTETDPDAKAQMQRRIAVLDQTEQHYTAVMQQQNANKAMALAATKEYAALAQRQQQVPMFTNGLTQLLRDYTTLERLKLLPPDPTMWGTWEAKIRQNVPGNWTPEAERAFQGIKQFFPEYVVGGARTFWNDIGVRTKDAFGPLQGHMLTFEQAQGYIDRAISNIKFFDQFANTRMKVLAAPVGESYRPPMAVAPEPEE